MKYWDNNGSHCVSGTHSAKDTEAHSLRFTGFVGQFANLSFLVLHIYLPWNLWNPLKHAENKVDPRILSGSDSKPRQPKQNIKTFFISAMLIISAKKSSWFESFVFCFFFPGCATYVKHGQHFLVERLELESLEGVRGQVPELVELEVQLQHG